MSGPPAPSPRRLVPKTPAQLSPVSPTSEEMPVCWVKKPPPPVAPKNYRLVRIGCQEETLPDAVSYSSSLDYGHYNAPSQRRIVTMNDSEEIYPCVMKSLPRQCVSLDQDMSSLRIGANQVPERVMYHQMSWDEDVKNSLTTSQQKRSDYKRSYTAPEKNFLRQENVVDANEDLREWWRNVTTWDEFSNSSVFKFREEDELSLLIEKVQRVQKALQFYNYLLTERGGTLQDHINELKEVANNLDKVTKGTKIAGITGGTAGAVGVAAAVGGVILAPLTMGASLAVTAVGVGVAAAGTATGASAAIANKVNKNLDRKKLEKILKDYIDQMEDIDKCLTFIHVGVDHLKRHNLSQLHGVDMELLTVAMVSQVAISSSGQDHDSKYSGLIQGFTLGMDMHFTKENSEKLKKGHKSKFAKQIRTMAEQLQVSLNEIMRVKNVLASQINI